MLVLQSVFVANLLDTHQFEAACMTGTIHEHMLGNELSIVLVRRSHIDLKSVLFSLLGERTDHIIRFKTRHFENRYIHSLQKLLYDRHSFLDILGCLRPLGLILLVCLVPESTSGRVKSYCQMGRIDFA